MRRKLQIAALGGALIVAGLWLALGAHRGWTRTSITEMRVDEITELEYPVIRSAFVPGVDFLAAGLLIAAAIAGASLIFSRSPHENDQAR
jgi:hypothetical protein